MIQPIKAGVPLVALLAACATPAVDLGATRDSWFGARYETVVAQWGAPTRSTVLADRDDNRSDAYTWVSESVSAGNWFPSLSVFGGSRGVGVGTGVVLGQSGGEPVRCERTLFFKDGQVVEQSWQGQSKFCSTFRRN